MPPFRILSARIGIIDRIIIAIAIQVQAVGGFGIQVAGIIRGDESSPLGVIVAGVQVIQPGLPVVVIAAVADGVGLFLFYHTPPGQSRKRLARKLQASPKISANKTTFIHLCLDLCEYFLVGTMIHKALKTLIESHSNHSILSVHS